MKSYIEKACEVDNKFMEFEYEMITRRGFSMGFVKREKRREAVSHEGKM